MRLALSACARLKSLHPEGRVHDRKPVQFHEPCSSSCSLRRPRPAPRPGRRVRTAVFRPPIAATLRWFARTVSERRTPGEPIRDLPATSVPSITHTIPDSPLLPPHGTRTGTALWQQSTPSDGPPHHCVLLLGCGPSYEHGVSYLHRGLELTYHTASHLPRTSRPFRVCGIPTHNKL